MKNFLLQKTISFCNDLYNVNYTEVDLLSSCRKKPLNFCRQALAGYCRMKLKYTYEMIGEIINRDHATVIHANKNCLNDSEIKRVYELFCDYIYQFETKDNLIIIRNLISTCVYPELLTELLITISRENKYLLLS